MKKDIKKIWLEALRSGKYLQARGLLREDNKFCCLGVLCDLHNKKFKKDNWDDEFDSEYEYLGADATLPIEVLVWAGLFDDDPQITMNNKSTTLATLNDGNDIGLEPKTFKQIANIIEKHL